MFDALPGTRGPVEASDVENITTRETNICWLQPRSLTQEEILRLARAQAYAAHITGDKEKSDEEKQDLTSSVPNGAADDKALDELEELPVNDEDTEPS